MIVYDRLYIGGAWTAPAHPGLLDIRSPHDGSLLGRAAQAAPGDADAAVAAARAAFNHGPWPHMHPKERRDVIRRVNRLREERAAEVAARISEGTGAPLRFTEPAQTSLNRRVEASLKAAEEFGWEEVLPADPCSGFDTIVRREPIGVVAAIVPWNSPFTSATAKLTPALLAGDTVVLKVTPENSLSMGLLAELYAEAGLPEGVLSVLPADRETGEYLAAHPDVDKIAFSGSSGDGRRMAAIAAGQLKRIGLAVGGRSAAVILDDADLGRTMRDLKYAGPGGDGGPCAGRARILAPRRRYEEVVAAVGDMVGSLTVGDPADPETFVGPMAGRERQQRVLSYIDLGIEEGARLVRGGPRVPTGLEAGCYVNPTVFADVDNRMRIAQEEIPGPVFTIIAHDGEDDAVRIAEDSEYGVSGGVWSADTERAMAVARRLRTRTVTVNGSPTGFDGTFGLSGYVEHKTLTRAR
ncbi:aldehyde dehydrogenase family protein [Streptomyces sp. NPDC026673]|uniref:aldehyde dehydrogenase family protein n=1 Tax=Streptomyces sp. NPDC026673 TaxID=3155724 RepID=UPI003401D097